MRGRLAGHICGRGPSCRSATPPSGRRWRARGVFVSADGGKAIILDVHTARGHGNGIVGLLLPEDVSAPSVAAVRERVAAAFD